MKQFCDITVCKYTGKIYVVIFRNSQVYADETNISQFNSFPDQLIVVADQQDN